MIIQIRGTSGSGKSTIMRQVMDDLGSWQSLYQPGRRKPYYYCCHADPRLIVLGHYDSACGGGDTIGSARQIYDMAMRLYRADTSRAILMEGLLLSEDTKWTFQMADECTTKTLFLTTDLETCIKQIKKRRKEVGNDKPLNETNTRNRFKVIERARKKLFVQGTMSVRRASPTQAKGIILRWLRNNPSLNLEKAC